MKLDDFCLNKAEYEMLLSYQKNDAFPHTMLIEGGSLDERISFSRFIANTIVCLSPLSKPCGSCSACIKCNAASNPDIKEFGEEKSGSAFKVELSREIVQDAFVIPNDGDKKVYILKEAQNMNASSENALLKILEEPPYFDYFILTSESRNAMLDTILSRATLISLADSKVELSPQAVEIANSVLRSLFENNELKTLEAIAPLSNKKENFEDTLECIKIILIDTLKYKQTKRNSSSYEETVEILCNKFSLGKIYELINISNELLNRFRQNANYNLLINSMCILLRSATGK